MRRSPRNIRNVVQVLCLLGNWQKIRSLSSGCQCVGVQYVLCAWCHAVACPVLGRVCACAVLWVCVALVPRHNMCVGVVCVFVCWCACDSGCHVCGECVCVCVVGVCVVGVCVCVCVCVCMSVCLVCVCVFVRE